MIAHGAIKKSGRLVGVVADHAALLKATRLRKPPDFFELRLDALVDCLDQLERALPILRAPLILTARHPAEGGRHALSGSARRALLRRFLVHAAFIDIDLRSAKEMRSLITESQGCKIGILISSHDLLDTPPSALLRDQLGAAIGRGADIFKIATRTDNGAQLQRLLSFFQENSDALPIAAMGLGKLGAESRRRLLHLGSALNYAAVGESNAPGQPTLRQLSRNRDAYTK